MDLKLDENGSLAFTNSNVDVTTIGAEDLAQRLLIRLSTFRGEWFMDNTLGIDWWERVFGKNRNKTTVDAIIQNEILKEKDVRQITEYSSSLTNRSYSATFKVRTEDGAVSEPIVFNISPPI